MAVIWGLPNWVWVAVAAVAVGASLVVVRVLGQAFASVRDLRDSLELSRKMLTSALESTQAEAERARTGLERLGKTRAGEAAAPAPPDEPWRDW